MLVSFPIAGSAVIGLLLAYAGKRVNDKGDGRKHQLLAVLAFIGSFISFLLAVRMSASNFGPAVTSVIAALFLNGIGVGLILIRQDEILRYVRESATKRTGQAKFRPPTPPGSS